MNTRRAALLSISAVLTVLLVFIVLVPAVHVSSRRTQICTPQGCVIVDYYESVSYFYGGFGAVYQTGVNQYYVSGWVCSCPPEQPGQNSPCCVPPLAPVVWPAVAVLVLVDLGSLVLAARLRPRPLAK